MQFKNIIALGALVASVAAIPMHQHHAKRDVMWKTVTDIEVTTITTTTTIWGAQPAAATPATNTGVAANHRQKHHTKRVKSTVTVVPSPAATSPATSPYVAPSPVTTPSTPTQAPATTPTTQPSTGSPSSGQNTGDITYYTPGLGSCGITSTDTDMIVALSIIMMDAELASTKTTNPNDNPYCGRKITISHGGTTEQATVVDSCSACSEYSIDLSPSLFTKFAPLSTGRVHDVNWWFTN